MIAPPRDPASWTAHHPVPVLCPPSSMPAGSHLTESISSFQRHSAMSSLQAGQHVHKHHPATTIHDIPPELLTLHLPSLAPQDRLALLRTDRTFRDVALGSADGLQFSIGIDQQGQCAAARAPATAEHAARLCPTLRLRLHSTAHGSSGHYNGPAAAPAITNSITAQLGQALTTLTLQVGLCLCSYFLPAGMCIGQQHLVC
jgi:hypothetical protein